MKDAFEGYALGYGAGMEQPLKRWLGRSAEEYLAVKVRWLVRDLRRRPLRERAEAAPVRLLDYGCGAGTFLRLLHGTGGDWDLHGWDVSPAMLQEAQRRWAGMDGVAWRLIAEGASSVGPTGQFDVVVLCCVLHHVMEGERSRTLAEALRAVRAGGRLYVFEHNPRNPVTRWVVRRTALDRGAELVSARALRAGLAALDVRQLRIGYMMFFPPRWSGLRPLEDYLTWCPWGAQYVMVATKA
jgi:SAM-dependent methyltransferase